MGKHRKNDEVVVIRREEDGEGPWKGFLMTRCEACGTVRGYCAKREIYSYRCKCGGETPLEGMKPLYLNCPGCGRSFKYRTNMTEREFETSCFQCGTKVKLRLNWAGTAYVTAE